MIFIRNKWMNIGFDTANPDAIPPDQPSDRLITIADVQLALDVAHVLEGQGIPPSQASPPLVATAEEVLGEARELLAPVALYTILPVRDFEHQQVVLDGGATFSGPLVARALAGAAEVAVAVCSIGPALDERVSALFAAGDPIRALALEGAGIAAVEQLAAMVGIRICDAATARGWSVGMRASPGQEGWPIQQQRVLFGLVPGEKIGVQLTSSCLMLPCKSVSFVVGLGPNLRADTVPCDFCSKRERCQWRAQKPDNN
jgi:hypothetical protein